MYQVNIDQLYTSKWPSETHLLVSFESNQSIEKKFQSNSPWSGEQDIGARNFWGRGDFCGMESFVFLKNSWNYSASNPKNARKWKIKIQNIVIILQYNGFFLLFFLTVIRGARHRSQKLLWTWWLLWNGVICIQEIHQGMKASLCNSSLFFPFIATAIRIV